MLYYPQSIAESNITFLRTRVFAPQNESPDLGGLSPVAALSLKNGAICSAVRVLRQIIEAKGSKFPVKRGKLRVKRGKLRVLNCGVGVKRGKLRVKRSKFRVKR